MLVSSYLVSWLIRKIKTVKWRPSDFLRLANKDIPENGIRITKQLIQKHGVVYWSSNLGVYNIDVEVEADNIGFLCMVILILEKTEENVFPANRSTVGGGSVAKTIEEKIVFTI